MRARFIAMSMLVVLLIIWHLPDSSFAEVVVDIGGTQLTDPTSVNITGNYGANCPAPSSSRQITITQKSTTAGLARVEVLDDSNIDYVALKNAKITANCAVTDFRIAFGFNHGVAPTVVPPDEIRYKYYSSGNLVRSGTTPPPGASVSTKASYRNTPPSPPATTYNTEGTIDSEQTRTTYSFSTSGYTSNMTDITDPRGLQAEFKFTLPAAADYLNMTQYYVQDTAAAGGGDGNSWERFLKRLLLLTASTSEATGCKGCFIADSSTPQAEKLEMFARTTWDSLSQELARGQGEHLASLATLLNVPAAEQPAFFALAQERYFILEQSGAATPDEVIADLKAQIAIRTPLASVSSPPGS